MEADSLVSASEIARLAGVTRAAVSNWRKRYADFPGPATGAGRSAMFPISEVQAWLGRHRKGTEVSGEVRIWQALRTAYANDMLSGLADVAELLASGTSNTLGPEIRSLVKQLTLANPPVEVVARLVERLEADRRLAHAVRYIAGPASGPVFDPACGSGSLLLAFADDPNAVLAGQEVDPAAARLARARARIAGHENFTVKVGHSLRDDQWRKLGAAFVVCQPPASATDWGREDLLLDPRWEFGIPTRAEGELAWLQHCFAHLAPGGKLALVVPPSVGYRTAGRRIRAELVRRGILTQVVALPPGMVASHAQPVHLWLLSRPASDTATSASTVRMVDLTANDADGPFDPAPHQIVDVPLIDLLDEVVDLTPAHHISASSTDHLAEYLATREMLISRLHELLGVLPPLTSGPGSLDGAAVRVADLARAKLVELSESGVVSASDQLDTDYLRGFVASTANTRRSTSGSGSYRTDVRSARIPQMGIEDQRLFGTAFRALEEFERRVKEVAALSDRAASLARDGLTSGALRPSGDRQERAGRTAP
ncbi:N-6 DNA methylase [Nonomuraea sp. NPDC055795]